MPDPIPRKRPQFAIILLLLLAAYLVGFVPMWWKARDQAAVREKAEHQLTIARIVKDLGSAAIDARRGEYEAARVEASAFFTSAHFEIDQGNKSALSQQQRETLLPLLAPRDELITLLARSDPASAERLTILYVSIRKVLGV